MIGTGLKQRRVGEIRDPLWPFAFLKSASERVFLAGGRRNASFARDRVPCLLESLDIFGNAALEARGLASHQVVALRRDCDIA